MHATNPYKVANSVLKVLILRIPIGRVAFVLTLLMAGGFPPAKPLVAQPYTSAHLSEPIEILSATFPYGRDVPVRLERDASRLTVTANNLNFAGKARLQIDDGPWTAIDNEHVLCDEQTRQYRCVGFPGTIVFSIPVDVPAGEHVVRFEVLRTDNLSSGYRILDLEFDAPFSVGHVAEFVAPDLAEDGDAANGRILFHEQNRWVDHPDGPPIIAACADCHIEGRDLKYFGYSDNSIIVRTEFHGGSVADGADIAAFIAGLDVPTLGTPWDPPYQPGPGMDDRPIIEWAAGAGLDAVVEEEEVRGYLFGPDGITADDFDAPPNHRELPLSAALPDWKDWLPTQWPGECHAGTERWAEVVAARDHMVSVAADPENTARDIEKAINQWAAKSQYLKNSNGSCTGSDEERLTAEWSAMAWGLVQAWYVHHAYALEERADEVYGYGPARSWLQRNRYAFNLGPHIANVNGLSNPPYRYASDYLESYMTHLWYQLQVVVNPGLSDDRASGQVPVDWGYQNAFLNGRDAPWRATASRMLQLHAMSDRPCEIAGGNVVAGEATCLGDQPSNPYWIASILFGGDRKTNEIFDTMPATDKLRVATFGLDWYLSRLESVPEFSRGDRSGQWKDSSYNPQSGDHRHTRARDIADMWWVRSSTLKNLGVPDSIMRRWDALGERLWPEAQWELLSYPGNPDLSEVDPAAVADVPAKPD